MCAKLPAKRQMAVAIDGLYYVEIKKKDRAWGGPLVNEYVT